MTFRAVFETLPIVEVPEYRGLAVKARAAAVTDEDLDGEVDRLREEHARFDPDRGAGRRERRLRRARPRLAARPTAARAGATRTR